MILQPMSLDEMVKQIDVAPASIGLEASNVLGGSVCSQISADNFYDLDPYSTEYSDKMLQLYKELSNNSSYNPVTAETVNSNTNPNPWTGISPYTFQSSTFVGDFIEACGAVMKALQVSSGQSVLEYGFGSGQALLMLARMGVKAHGVDIDMSTLKVCRKQAEAMGLNVALGQNVFGEGFGDKKFDRIFFFEAFHHAFKFKELLLRLHERLEQDGFVVLSGEPIVEPDSPIVPYPWGLRLDGLSMYCIRKYGWMELGFQSEFFTELAMSTGWKLTKKSHDSFRSVCYVLEPMGSEINMGGDFELPSSWSTPEIDHRWTSSRTTALPLPWLKRDTGSVVITAGNFLADTKTLGVRIGDNHQEFEIPSGKERTFEVKCPKNSRSIVFESELTRIEGGRRKVGVAVKHISLKPSA